MCYYPQIGRTIVGQSTSSMKLRPEELTKIECARKFFAEISRTDLPNNVRYDVVDNYVKLMAVVARQ